MKERYARQGFLGEVGQRNVETARVGIVGVGGGGSHTAPQLAHLGVQSFAIFDADTAGESNLNRTMTLIAKDIENKTLKVAAAKRRILEINPKAKVDVYPCRWQDLPDTLSACHVVTGQVDSFTERHQLEAFCRRHIIPYIDVGMDITSADEGPPGMGGQVIASLPGGPCMFCIGFLTDEKLAREADNYGAAGGRPQVVWANGVLASTAVGLVVELLTGWTLEQRDVVYLSYRGNDGTITQHARLSALRQFGLGPCPHYPPDAVGEVVFKPL